MYLSIIIIMYQLGRGDLQRVTLERCRKTPISQQIKRYDWKWIGHTLRRDSNHILKQTLVWKQGEKAEAWLAQDNLAS
ncbi:unnamed protein product [Pieris macdunnoughi]|uniref:Uncharacterized protein n=1 Tax=Pieris macdunnoughi TaxID=345717 RepID=A0A821QNW5_9NEOP|nr:unnamed protein product [Pieris macdunnoughi]